VAVKVVVDDDDEDDLRGFLVALRVVGVLLVVMVGDFVFLAPFLVVLDFFFLGTDSVRAAAPFESFVLLLVAAGTKLSAAVAAGVMEAAVGLESGLLFVF